MNDLSYLALIAKDELTSLKELIHQKTTLTTELWEQFGTSGFYLLLLAFRDDLSGNDLKELEAAYADFLQLCESAPDTDPDCLLHFSNAYANLLLAINGDSETLTADERVRSLIFATESRIFALLPSVTASMLDHFSVKKKKLSEAGRSGAERKHQGVKAIKEWALKAAEGMKKSHMDIAEALSKALPPHLIKISKRPERLIYDTLRANTVK